MRNGVNPGQTGVLLAEVKELPAVSVARPLCTRRLPIPEFLSTENATECDFHLGHSPIAP